MHLQDGGECPEEPGWGNGGEVPQARLPVQRPGPGLRQEKGRPHGYFIILIWWVIDLCPLCVRRVFRKVTTVGYKIATYGIYFTNLKTSHCSSHFFHRVADPDRISGSGSGSRRAKMTHKSRKKFEISRFEMMDILFWELKVSFVTWASLWRPRDS